MKRMILQNLTHRGTVSAEGFFFSARLLPESETRRRILALWQPNAKVFRHGADLIMLFPRDFRVDCRRAYGLPLVRYDKILAAFPLRKRDFEFFEDAGDAVILANEGRVETIFIHDLQAENPESWFDVSAFQVVETETLGEVKPRPIYLEKTEAVNLREELEGVPKASAEMAEVLDILKRKRRELAQAHSNQTAQTDDYFGGLSESVGGFFDALKNLFSSGSEGNRQLAAQNKPPGKLQRMFTKMMLQTKIAQVIGRKQAEYLARMMQMFEDGDLDAALKHAIPLADMESLKQAGEGLPFLGILRPRPDLNINYGAQTESASAVFLEDNWFENLRQLYRQTFDRLVAQNRIEEAAFVLAELLQNSGEAVNFLEKHGKFRLAAQLAESRDLPKDIIVRQWFLAGEKRRAVQIAILHNSFEYVVMKLEAENHPQAADLREIWAENLANRGNYAAAVNTIWKLEDRRMRAREWIDLGIEFGGVRAAELLAKKITLFPESFEEVKSKLFEITAENGDEAEEKRIAFARETMKLVSPNDELRLLIRPLARKITADLARQSFRFTANELRQLVEKSGDYALRTDLPKLPEKNAGQNAAETLRLEVSERDLGAAHIYDACLLPDGKLAVALGEAGVKILSRKGKTIAHFDQPTERFVVSDFGTKAICLARRGKEIWRLTKIDFAMRRAEYWCEAAFSVFAPTFDGNLWFVAGDDEIYAIDANAKSFEAVWRVAEIGDDVYEISRSNSKLVLLVNFAGKGFEKWSYDLPGFTLRSRNQTKGWYETKNEKQVLADISAFIAHTVAIKQQIGDNQKSSFEAEIYDYETKLADHEFSSETIAVKKPQIVERQYVLTSQTNDATVISLYEIAKFNTASFHLKNSKHAAVKLDEKYLTITDEHGRVIIFDHREKVLRANLRL